MENLSEPGETLGRAGDALIKDSDTAGFAADVIEASKSVPVIVDFWAPWCGPCKQLTPVLEKLVTLGGGVVRLVKINIDDNQQLASQLQVRSVPSVFGFKHGQPVDGFTGALPESQVKAFIDRLTGGAKSPLDEALDHAAAVLEQGDAATAGDIYAQVLDRDQMNTRALAGMIRCYLASGDTAQANDLVSGLDNASKADPDVAAAIAALELAAQGEATEGVDTGQLEARLAANENDHQARFDLALALYGAGQPEPALDCLLEIIGRDRTWNEEAARLQIVKIFEALGPSDPLTVSARRRLSSMLFS